MRGSPLSDFGEETALNFLNPIMALRKVKGNFERMFDKNLTDLVRGIRNNKENEVIFIGSISQFFLVKSHQNLT